MKAVSNTSTLIRFYRARSFLRAFRSYYNEGILVPSFCWAELERPPLRPENELMREDLAAGLIVLVEPTQEEEELATHLILAIKDLTGLDLDPPEAVAIAIAELRGIRHVLSDDRVALAVPHIIELKVEVLNSLAVLKEMAKASLLGVRTLADFRRIVERFQAEARERFSHEDMLKALMELSELSGA